MPLCKEMFRQRVNTVSVSMEADSLCKLSSFSGKNRLKLMGCKKCFSNSALRDKLFLETQDVVCLAVI